MKTAVYLIAIGGLRLAVKSGRSSSATDWLMIAVPITLGLLVFAFGSHMGLFYPTIISLGFLLIFYSTLSTPRNFIQRIAEKIEKQPLDSIGIKYTSYVTRIWCVFFLVNAAISTFLAWRKMLEEWTIYNGFIAYALIALLFAGERLVRHSVQLKMRHTDGIDGD